MFVTTLLSAAYAFLSLLIFILFNFTQIRGNVVRQITRCFIIQCRCTRFLYYYIIWYARMVFVRFFTQACMCVRVHQGESQLWHTRRHPVALHHGGT